MPVYLSEISDPTHRGFIGGLSGFNLSCGIMVSNWVGFACNYAPYGQLQWRLPLALQIPWGVIMFIGLITFMPNSPRHLLQRGKVEEARKAFVRVRRDLQSDEVHEFALMTSQIAFEHEQRSPSWASNFKRYRHRVLVQVILQAAGVFTRELTKQPGPSQFRSDRRYRCQCDSGELCSTTQRKRPAKPKPNVVLPKLVVSICRLGNSIGQIYSNPLQIPQH